MKKIVLAEDDTYLNPALTTVLTEAGYEVKSAFNGEEALEHVDDAETLDLLITDISMAYGSGYGLINALGKLGHTFPILVAAANFKRELVEYDGDIYFLQKPYDKEEFLSMVQRILEE